jgi:hypothetical protein
MSAKTLVDTPAEGTGEYYEAEFYRYRQDELLHLGRLNRTIFAEAKALNMWRAMANSTLDDKKLREVARKAGLKVGTVRDRMEAEREIPEAHRKDNLAFGAHQEVLKIKFPDEKVTSPQIEEAVLQARWDVLDELGDAKTEATIADVRDAVIEKRAYLTKRWGPDVFPAPRGVDAPIVCNPLIGDSERERIRARMAGLNWSGGFPMSDGESGIADVKGTYQQAECRLTVNCTASIAHKPVVTMQPDNKTFTVTWAVDPDALAGESA